MLQYFLTFSGIITTLITLNKGNNLPQRTPGTQRNMYYKKYLLGRG